MTIAESKLVADAQQIWQAGLDAVRSERLMREAVQVSGDTLVIDGEPLDLRPVQRIAVVGGGKAGAGMAAELETMLGERLLTEKQVTGWVNVPEDCVRRLRRIQLHAARPASRNEPTEAGVFGVRQMLELVGSLTADDLCLALISGGGSALMPAPAPGVALADKLALTRYLSGAGANIAELNIVRKQLSEIKGGGLARHCRAGTLISLIISDVLGDPLDVIASGPTVPDESTPADALDVLNRFGAVELNIAPAAVAHLSRRVGSAHQTSRTMGQARQISRRVGQARRGRRPTIAPQCQIRNVVIGNNARAVDAAGTAAEHLGYSHAMVAATELEGPVEEIGRHLARMAIQMRDNSGPNCLISGGEGTVALATEKERGLGGRNQQLVLAALDELLVNDPKGGRGIAILSGGTDGEDGPTDAAGAWFDSATIAEARRRKLDPSEHLRRDDAYHFFEPIGALLKTGPTHTNVCDVRVVVVQRP
jgi:hydroxypyruvate reductase